MTLPPLHKRRDPLTARTARTLSEVDERAQDWWEGPRPPTRLIAVEVADPDPSRLRRILRAAWRSLTGEPKWTSQN